MIRLEGGGLKEAPRALNLVSQNSDASSISLMLQVNISNSVSLFNETTHQGRFGKMAVRRSRGSGQVKGKTTAGVTGNETQPARKGLGKSGETCVATKTPKHRATQQTYILGKSEQGRPTGAEFVGNGREDERGNDRPQVVRSPSKSDNDEELPLIPSHTDILDLDSMSDSLIFESIAYCTVQDTSFGLVDRVDGAFWDCPSIVDAEGDIAPET